MIGWDLGEDRILLLTIDDPEQRANTMTDAFERSLLETVERLEDERASYHGVILTSGKETFIAGGDLTAFVDAGPDDLPATRTRLDTYKRAFRRLELLGKPVVAALNGTALGGGFEVALACHHRIALDVGRSRLGLPEVTWGLLPGAGGVTRVVRMLGLSRTMAEVLVEGRRYSPAEALAIGLVDELVGTKEELVDRASAWIRANPDAAQPWDREGYLLPESGPAADLLRDPTDPALMPAPSAVLTVAVQGAGTDLETAFAIETRYCADLICGRVSTNIIKALFIDLNHASKNKERPGSRAIDAAFIDRLQGALNREADAIVAEGTDPESVERAARRTGLSRARLEVSARTSEGDRPLPERDVRERLLVAMSLEALRCLSEGVVGSAEEANVVSVLGAGFPVWTGGAVRFAHDYDGGVSGFVERADQLSGQAKRR